MTIRELDITNLSLDEYVALTSLSKNDGYMAMYLDILIQARAVHKKTDFYCKIVVAEDDLGIVGWALVQDLLYRYKHYAELNIYVDRQHRGRGVGSRLIKFFIPQDKPLIAWAGTPENISLYKKFKDDILVLDIDKYHNLGIYEKFKF
jgi:GNAT superfamily N-acetyltransferase